MMGEAGELRGVQDKFKKLFKSNFYQAFQTQIPGWVMLWKTGQRLSNGSGSWGKILNTAAVNTSVCINREKKKKKNQNTTN